MTDKWATLSINLKPLYKQLRKDRILFSPEAATVIYDAAAHVGLNVLQAQMVYVSNAKVLIIMHRHMAKPFNYHTGKMDWPAWMFYSHSLTTFSGMIHRHICPETEPAFTFEAKYKDRTNISEICGTLASLGTTGEVNAQQDYALKTGAKAEGNAYQKIPEIYRRGISLHKCPETFETLSVISTPPTVFARNHLTVIEREHEIKMSKKEQKQYA